MMLVPEVHIILLYFVVHAICAVVFHSEELMMVRNIVKYICHTHSGRVCLQNVILNVCYISNTPWPRAPRSRSTLSHFYNLAGDAPKLHHTQLTSTLPSFSFRFPVASVVNWNLYEV